MNAVSNSATDFIDENVGGSDSDSNHEELPEYYQPIAFGDDGDISDQADPDQNSDEDTDLHRLPNGYARCVENRMSTLDLSDDEESEEEEEERVREASDSAVLRAFTEDENRRNAPLTAENATRVMEAMRGISFGGLAPDWADRVPENQWINRLRRLRRAPTTIQD